jgi:hypothetical protein
MTEREFGAIECFLDDCTWTKALPVEVVYTTSQDERDDIATAHLFDTHTVVEIGEQIDLFLEAVITDRSLSQEQVEDRNAIIRVLRAAAFAHPGDAASPERPSGHRPSP